MNKEKSDSKITFSQETQLTVRKRKTAFSVDLEDWERIKRYINNYSKSSNLSQNIMSIGFSSALAIFLTFLTILDQKEYPFRVHLIVSIAIFLTIGITSLIYSRLQKKSENTTKDQILEEMKLIEVVPVEEPEELSKDFPDWIATRQPSNQQETDYREIPLENQSLKSLTFKISSTSPFWRAGFKLSTINSTMFPLLNPGSFLFHLGVTNDPNVGLTIYNDGKTTPTISKNLPSLSNTQIITIRVEIDENSSVNCYVNDSLEYSEKFDSELFKKIYLAAWGDGNQYEVKFSDISYYTI